LPEQTHQALPKLKRLWKARNTLSSKLSERRAKLRREGIIDDDHDQSFESDDDDDTDDANDDSSELWVSAFFIVRHGGLYP